MSETGTQNSDHVGRLSVRSPAHETDVIAQLMNYDSEYDNRKGFSKAVNTPTHTFNKEFTFHFTKYKR